MSHPKEYILNDATNLVGVTQPTRYPGKVPIVGSIPCMWKRNPHRAIAPVASMIIVQRSAKEVHLRRR